jgi:LPXTG-site transpeptidase (sortase) family protein
VQTSIVGVPQTDDTWNITWLGEKAGWLEGSAFPTWAGNSVITGHVWNADNTQGIFVNISQLIWGGRIIVHFQDQQYIYEVRAVESVLPTDIQKMMAHQDSPWITLVTCKGLDQTRGVYQSRVLVKSVLVEIKPDSLKK